MTTLLAYHDGKRGYIAADSRRSSGNEIVSDAIRKVIRLPGGHWLIAATGPSLAAELIRRRLPMFDGLDDAWDISQRLKEVLADAGWTGMAKDGDPPTVSCSFLLVGPPGAYIIFDSFCPTVQDRPCYGGTGGAHAAGAFMGAKAAWEIADRPGDVLPVTAYMEAAIRIACLYDHNSGGEPQVEVTE